MNVRTHSRAAIACVVALLLTACSSSQSRNGSSSSTPSANDACDKPVHVKLSAGAGRIKLPVCDGWDLTLEYPAEASRSSRDATIKVGTDNFNNLPPPVNYGRPFLYMSIVSATNRRNDHTMRLLLSHARNDAWNHERRYVYSRYEDMNGPVAGESLGVVTCKDKVCHAATVSPLVGLFELDSRVDIQFIRDPGLTDIEPTPD